MTYEQLFQNTLGKYSSASGAGVIVPIPVEPEATVVTEFNIADTVTFHNGGTGRYVTATVAPEGLEAYDNQLVTNAKAVISTGTQTLNMWVTMTVNEGEAEMEMDFSQVPNPNKLTGDSVVVTANLTWDDGGATEDVTFNMTADLVLPVGDNRNYMCFTNIEDTNNTITLEKTGNPSEEVVCYYSFNKSTWTIIRTDIEGDGTCVSITLEPNQKVYFKGVGTWAKEGNNASGYSQYVFQSSGRINLSGNILSIWNYNNFDELTEMPKNNTMGMFKKYSPDGTALNRSFLKVVNADMSFDNIAKVEQTKSRAPNMCVLWALFCGTADSPNTYLQSCKLDFKSGVVINAVNGSSWARSPFSQMLSYCTSLNSIWLPNWSGTSTWNQNKFIDGITTTGTVYLAQGKTIITGVNGVPSTWTKVYYNPTTGEIIENN